MSMSLTDGAATSESQASLSVVILILYTHTRMSPCFLTISLVLTFFQLFESPFDHHPPSAIPPQPSQHFPSLPCSSGLLARPPWCPSSHCGRHSWPWRALAEELDPTGAAGSWKHWLRRWLSHTWEQTEDIRKLHNVKPSHHLLTGGCDDLSHPTHGAALLLGEGRRSQKAEGLHSIIHLRAPPPASGSSISLQNFTNRPHRRSK